jgi:hypothetical protein
MDFHHFHFFAIQEGGSLGGRDGRPPVQGVHAMIDVCTFDGLGGANHGGLDAA